MTFSLPTLEPQGVAPAPEVVAAAVADHPGARVLKVRSVYGATVVFMELTPPQEFASAAFPVEVVKVVVPQGTTPVAYPRTETERPWKHRNPSGELCLWYVDDPRALRWEPEDGLTAFISIVHRHLLYEECARRTGEWPAEDAPHGRGRHPITRRETRRAARRWARP